MLENKTIIVTGGSGLIGTAIIKHINSNGGKAINFDYEDGYDITKVDTIQKFISDKDITTVDGIVNNAYPRTEHWGNDVENEVDNVFDDNVKLQLGGLHTFTKAFLPYLKESKGSVVNIASIYGIVANDFSLYENTDMSSPAAYCAIKGATINLTRYMASYYGKKGSSFDSTVSSW